eukprot:TRINITY_DN592_c0_g1_i13.p2 TRINITY_DN592_c0_g1~~TRINITY_DN592_c0_g1_i13.p2  ORF type:complete len:210 (+),score=45.26 TRINITY_DN592_c0_g1_i13:88-630(+)
MCEYNTEEAKKQECYVKCLAEERQNGKVGSHNETAEAKETTVHLIQVKQEIEQGPIEQTCKKNKMCEECGISWGCNFSTIKGIDRETCWKGCLDEHNDYDAQHDNTMKQKETNMPVSYTHLTLPTKRIVQISVVAVSLTKKTKGQTATGQKDIHAEKIHHSPTQPVNQNTSRKMQCKQIL